MADVPVINTKTGETGAISEDELQLASADGWKPVAQQQEEDAAEAQHAKYGSPGQMAATVAEGAAHSIPLLPVDTIESKVFGVPEEDIKGRAQENPIAHGAGFLGGALGLGALTGGGSVAAEGATLGAKVAGAALSGALTNAAYKTGDLIDEKILGDNPDLTAAHMAGEIGMAGVYGAGLGGFFGLAGQGISKGLEKISGVSEKAAKTADEAISVAQAGKSGLSNAARAGAASENEAIDGMSGEIDKMFTARSKETSSLIGSMPVEDARAVATDTQQTLRAKIETMKAAPKVYHPGVVEEAEGVVNDLDKKIAESKTATDIFHAKDEAKGVLAKLGKSITDPNSDKFTAGNVVKTMGHDLKTGLEDERWDIAGDGAGNRQKLFNGAYTRYNNALKRVYKSLGYNEEQLSGAKLPRISSAKYESFLKSVSQDSTRGDIAKAAMNDLADARSNLLDQAQVTYKNAGNLPKNQSELNTLFQRAQDLRASGTKFAGQVAEGAPESLLQKAAEVGGGAVGSALGGAIFPAGGHIVGALGGAALGRGLVKSGASTVLEQQVLAKMYGLAAAGSQKLANGVSSFLGGRAAGAAMEVGRMLNRPLEDGQLEGASTRGEGSYNKRVQEIQTLANNPNTLMNSLAKKTEGISAAAPNTSVALHSAAARGVQYLNSLIPPAPGEGDMLPTKATPSAGDKARLATAWEVVNKPIPAVFGAMRANRLSTAHVVAFQTVYPELYQAAVAEVGKQLTAKPNRKLTIPQQQQLSTFLQKPVKSSYGPGMAAFVAQSSQIKQQNEQQNAPPPGSKPRGGSKASKLKSVASNELTPAQASGTREQ